MTPTYPQADLAQRSTNNLYLNDLQYANTYNPNTYSHPTAIFSRFPTLIVRQRFKREISFDFFRTGRGMRSNKP